MNDWEITDDKGVIYSGTEEEIRTRFDNIVNRKKGYVMKWQGDLKLVQVHAVHR